MKKLENVRKDHSQRLIGLEKVQEVDKQKGELITRNQELVDSAILSIQMLLGQQMSWADIDEVVNDAQAKGDPAALIIKKLKLEINNISLFLTDPYAESDASDQENQNEDKIPSMMVDVDLDLTAFANARRYTLIQATKTCVTQFAADTTTRNDQRRKSSKKLWSRIQKP